jgi:hypothetical protein
MSVADDPFTLLANSLTALGQQVADLKRTSLDREEAEAFSKGIEGFLTDLVKVPKGLQQSMQRDLADATRDIRVTTVEAAQRAAREAIEKSHAETLRAAQSYATAAGEARSAAWRHFGGFWVWLASVGTAGALLGALVIFWLQGRADAEAFGQYPGIYCTSAGGQIVTNTEGRRFCAFWIDPDPAENGN